MASAIGLLRAVVFVGLGCVFPLAPSFFFSRRLPGVQIGEVPFFPLWWALGGLGLFPLSLPRSFLVPIGGGTDPRAAVVLPLGVSLAKRSVMLRFNPDMRSPNGGACGNSMLGAYVSQEDRHPTDGAIKCPVFNRPGRGQWTT